MALRDGLLKRAQAFARGDGVRAATLAIVPLASIVVATAPVQGAPNGDSGACCLPAGNCESKESEAACTASGGMFQANVLCDDANCMPFSACCLSGGGCMDLTEFDCDNAPGFFHQPNTTCAMAVCGADLVVTKTVDEAQPLEGTEVLYTITVANNGPQNATSVVVTDLLPAGVTFLGIDTLTFGSYNAITGAWAIGLVDTIDPVVLELRAFVNPGTAGTMITNTAMVTAADQSDPDATNNQSDAPINPRTATGACCLDGEPCQALSQADCTAQEGIYRGDDVACDSLCDDGSTACCLADGSCVVLTGPNCGAVEGVINPQGTSCEAAMCPGPPAPSGACCVAGMCTIETQLACLLMNGAYLANGSACDPGACDDLDTKAACCFGDGSCAVLPPAECMALMGMNQPFGTSCSAPICPVPAPPVPGCCLPGGSCQFITPVECNSMGGLVQAPFFICVDDECPADLAITKTVDETLPVEESVVCYTIMVTNNGPNDATNVDVEDPLPPGVTFINTPVIDGSYNPVSGLWDVGSLGNGETATLQIKAFVNPGTAATTGTGAFIDEFATAPAMVNHRTMTFGPDGTLYAAANGTVFRFDEAGTLIDSLTIINAFLAAVAVGPDGNLYIADAAQHRVTRHNGTTGALIDVFVPVGSGGVNTPSDLTFGPDGHLYVMSRLTNQVLRYDGTAGVFIDAFVAATPFESRRLSFGPDGNLYVLSASADTVDRFDGSSGAFIDVFIDPGVDLISIAFGPDGNLYLGSFPAQVLRIDGATGAFIEAFATVPGGAQSLAFGLDGNLYVGTSTLGPDPILRYRGFIENIATITDADQPDPDLLNNEDAAAIDPQSGTGACCIDAMTCEVLTQAQCTMQGGIYRGDDVPCSADLCLVPAAACCSADGSCLVLTDANCLATGGTPMPGIDCGTATCPGPPPPTGGCCRDMICQVTTQIECLVTGGSYLGDGAACTGGICDDLNNLGACCLDGVCTVVEEDDCMAMGQDFQGDGTSCSAPICPSPPPPVGACCAADAGCTEITLLECDTSGGVYQGDLVPCDAICEPFGACCTGANTCLDQRTEAMCLAAGGAYQGDETLCVDVESCGQGDRGSASEKGSILIYSGVELRLGSVVQDVFLSISNDFPAEVKVQLYFINGDPPLPADPVTGEPFSPGWNRFDATITLTANQTAFWSLYSGTPGPDGDPVSPFTALDADGRPANDGTGDRILRGYVLAWAVNADGQPIAWNHLYGRTLSIHYRDGTAHEYNAQAIAEALGRPTGQPVGPGGVLNLNGNDFVQPYGDLLLDFYASGAEPFSSAAQVLGIDTSLTLHPVSADLRQDGQPVTTKAEFVIWDENEISHSGLTRCVTCWDSTLLSLYSGTINHFLVGNLGTYKGRAVIRGVQSAQCDTAGTCCHLHANPSEPGCSDVDCQWVVCNQDPFCCGLGNAGGLWDDRCVNVARALCAGCSTDAALAGVSVKHHIQGGAVTARSGMNLHGRGTEPATIFYSPELSGGGGQPDPLTGPDGVTTLDGLLRAIDAALPAKRD